MEFIRKTELNGCIPTRIDFNYGELKASLEDKLAKYQNVEKTDASNYKEHKNDRARLNDFARALNDEKKSIKKTLLAPMENGTTENPSFNSKIDELIGLIKMTSGQLDESIKNYEEKCKSEKREFIIARMNDEVESSISCYGELFAKSGHFARFAEENMTKKVGSWLNATTSEDAIIHGIKTEVARCVNEIRLVTKYIENDSDMVKLKASQELSISFDATKAIGVAQQVREDEELLSNKNKEEETRHSKEMATKVTLQEPISATGAKPELYSCVIKFVGTSQSLKNLREYLDSNPDIAFSIVQKMTAIQE